VLDHT